MIGREPRLSNASKGGDAIRFFVRNNRTGVQFESLQTQAQPLVLPVERAPAVSIR